MNQAGLYWTFKAVTEDNPGVLRDRVSRFRFTVHQCRPSIQPASLRFPPIRQRMSLTRGFASPLLGSGFAKHHPTGADESSLTAELRSAVRLCPPLIPPRQTFLPSSVIPVVGRIHALGFCRLRRSCCARRIRQHSGTSQPSIRKIPDSLLLVRFIARTRWKGGFGKCYHSTGVIYRPAGWTQIAGRTSRVISTPLKLRHQLRFSRCSSVFNSCC